MSDFLLGLRVARAVMLMVIKEPVAMSRVKINCRPRQVVFCRTAFYFAPNGVEIGVESLLAWQLFELKHSTSTNGYVFTYSKPN